MSTPHPPSPTPDPSPCPGCGLRASTLDALAAVDSASLDDGVEAPRRKSHARGQTVQMPFFSFVPRG